MTCDPAPAPRLTHAELLERISSLEDDIGIYRDLASRAFHLLRDLTAHQQAVRYTRARMRADALAARWAAHEATQGTRQREPGNTPPHPTQRSRGPHA